MGKESCWADNSDDAAIDRWTKIIQKGKIQILFKEQFDINVTARTAPVEGPTIRDAECCQAHADLVEAPGVEVLEALEGRLMNTIRDVFEEVNKTSFHWVTF